MAGLTYLKEKTCPLDAVSPPDKPYRKTGCIICRR